MPFGMKPQCNICETTAATIWKRNEVNEVVCNDCFASQNMKDVVELEAATTTTLSSAAENNNNNNNLLSSEVNNDAHQSRSSSLSSEKAATTQHVVRKSTRTTKSSAGKQRNAPTSKPNAAKGKGRRVIFKKSATKAPAAVATVVTTGSVFHKGNYFQIGDVVSMIDVQGGIYYAQIRGLLQDQYCEKSTVVTWLLPTESSPEPEDGFDPSTYIIGPEEDVPRRLDCMEFVCHAPSEYFKAKNSPYPIESTKPELGFVWSRLRPQIKPLRNKDNTIF